ncbi:MAG TPA: thermonuclease family protein [Terriglobales bacterium]|nr:thermonuclease family protein [Terriglobales bacterium]
MAGSPYLFCIHGNFTLIGKQPDGDSVRFIANDPSAFDVLHRSERIKPSTVDGSVQLRFEGIDAPELHYGSAAQPLGAEARDELLKKMGFKGLTFNGTTVTASKPASLPGAILSTAAEANGRPVSYVLVDENLPPEKTWVHVDNTMLKKTMNVHMIESGLAYYTVYTSMPKTHRTFFRAAATQTRNAARPAAATATAGGGTGTTTGKKSVWSLDASSDFVLDDQISIGPSGNLILPKLFRRCTDYLKDVKDGKFDGNLADWIRSKNQGSRSENDKVIVLGAGTSAIEVNFADLIQQHNRNVSLQADLLDLVFVEK